MEPEDVAQPDLAAEIVGLKQSLDQARMAYTIERVTKEALAERSARIAIAAEDRAMQERRA